MVISDFASFVSSFCSEVLSRVYSDIWFELDGGYLPAALFLISMILGFGVFLIRRALFNR